MGKKWRKFFAITGLSILIVGGVGAYLAYDFYKDLKHPNVVANEQGFTIFIYPEHTYNDVKASLEDMKALKNMASFDRIASFRNYKHNVRAGKFSFKSGISNEELVGLLRFGNQDDVRLTITKRRLKSELAGVVSKKILADSAQIVARLNDEAFWQKKGITAEQSLTYIIPNTYFVRWTYDVDAFFDRMEQEYTAFWTDERLLMAEAQNLTPQQAYILASIVEEETIKADEKPVVAGLYLNRYRIGMLLQADPTVKYAWQDFGLRRVLNKHLEKDSPYNTYKYGGLPPGPICIPTMSSLKAVLSPTEHNYLFMCAKADFSGYHAFATNSAGHGRNARAYQQALNQRRIYK